METPLSILDVLIVTLLAVNCSNVSIEKEDLQKIKQYKCEVTK